MSDDYLVVNRANWDDRAPAHAASPDYAVERLVEEPGHLSGVVEFDRPRLGDLRGLDVVHLQCHIGTDTLSLARLGARSVTGLDLSPASLAEARSLARRAGTEIRYVESEVYRALEVLEPASFDLVYTGVGALCWLPDIVRWAEVVEGLLRPGGRLFIRDTHPLLWALEAAGDQLTLAWAYFQQEEAQVWDDGGTYVETDAEFTHNRTMEWNHGLGEIVSAVLGTGMTITGLEEHDSAPWDPFPGLTTCDERGERRLREHPERLAATFTLQAHKPAR